MHTHPNLGSQLFCSFGWGTDLKMLGIVSCSLFLPFGTFSSSYLLKIGATEVVVAAATVSLLLIYLDSLMFKASNGFT